MLENYVPVLIFLLFGIIGGLIGPCIGYLRGPRRPSAAKLAAYECGFDPVDDARLPVDIRYYLVAILFIIFDVETAFLVPWAIVFRDLGWFGMGVMGLFIFFLTLGFVYEWHKGGLEWE